MYSPAPHSPLPPFRLDVNPLCLGLFWRCLECVWCPGRDWQRSTHHSESGRCEYSPHPQSPNSTHPLTPFSLWACQCRAQAFLVLYITSANSMYKEFNHQSGHHRSRKVSKCSSVAHHWGWSIETVSMVIMLCLGGHCVCKNLKQNLHSLVLLFGTSYCW